MFSGVKIADERRRIITLFLLNLIIGLRTKTNVRLTGIVHKMAEMQMLVACGIGGKFVFSFYAIKHY